MSIEQYFRVFYYDVPGWNVYPTLCVPHYPLPCHIREGGAVRVKGLNRQIATIHCRGILIHMNSQTVTAVEKLGSAENFQVRGW